MNRCLIFVFLVASISACTSGRDTTAAIVPPANVEFLESTGARSRAPERYFATEWRRIRERREHFGFESSAEGTRPPLIVGVALSGGGIRSNAFQMGILSGLYAERFGNARLLDRVDYVSSVSGGTWANAALWSWPEDPAILFQCLDDAAAGKDATTESCKLAVRTLRENQKPEIFSWFGRQRKEHWQDAIREAHVPRCDEHFDALTPECARNLLVKPFLIINSTHTEKGGRFPFESTPDGLGTVVDAGPYQGFLLRFDRTGAEWERRKFFQAIIPGGERGLYNGAQLSLAVASSSAVIEGPKVIRASFLPFYFQVTENGQPTTNPAFRKRYVLADGGQSDNTGIVPLVDRGADIIIASYMGKEGVETPFGDFIAARQLAKDLFSCTFSDIEDAPRHPRAQEGTYSCPAFAASSQRAVQHIHPWPGENIAEFKTWLRKRAEASDAGAAESLVYLDTEDVKLPAANQFPQTKTFKVTYDRRLIRAYYLLGKFIAETDIAPYLSTRLR